MALVASDSAVASRSHVAHFTDVEDRVSPLTDGARLTGPTERVTASLPDLVRSEAGAILPGRPFQKVGLCLPFYNQRWHSLKHFEGYREHVLDRDGHACRVCAGQEWIIVHHRAVSRIRT